MTGNPFPCRCYVLRETEKAVLLRPENDPFFSEFTFWIPKSALKKFEMVGYSENSFPVKDVAIHFWWEEKVEEEFNKQFEKKSAEGFDYECKLNKKYRCTLHGCVKKQDCNCPWDCEKLLRIQKRRKEMG